MNARMLKVEKSTSPLMYDHFEFQSELIHQIIL